MYADDNDDRICCFSIMKAHCDWCSTPTKCPSETSADCPGYQTDKEKAVYKDQWPWFEYPHKWNTSTLPSDGAEKQQTTNTHYYCPGIPLGQATKDDWQHAIACGALWKYIKDYKLYACPVGEKGVWVTYNGVRSMNGHYHQHWCNPDSSCPYFGGTIGGPIPEETHPHRYRMGIKNTALRMVFMDIGELDCGSWNLYNKENGWGKLPPMRHGKGTTFAFLDGHSEYRKWKNKTTLEIKINSIGVAEPVNLCNEDLFFMQRAICGRLAYTPPAACKTE